MSDVRNFISIDADGNVTEALIQSNYPIGDNALGSAWAPISDDDYMDLVDDEESAELAGLGAVDKAFRQMELRTTRAQELAESIMKRLGVGRSVEPPALTKTEEKGEDDAE